MREHGIDKIVKGYRTEADIPWEREQAEWNMVHGGYETELWKCEEKYISVSSTRVREALLSGNCEEAKRLLDPKVYNYISVHFNPSVNRG